ncbi:MAG TPA: hypothetical protein VE057_04710 [Archangium sp.]|nr:hypothetical protein [Archangium sp.]
MKVRVGGPIHLLGGEAAALFVAMSRNARSATAFFHIPPNRVVELGTQVEL